MDLSLLLVYALVGAVLAVFLLEVVIRRPVVAAGIIAVDVAVRYADVPLPSLPLGSVSVYDYDLVFALIGAAAIARLLRKRSFTWLQRVLLLATVIALFSLVEGIRAFGLETAVNESRRWLFIFVTALYFTTVVSREVLHRVAWTLVWAGTALTGVALVRWVVVAIGGPTALLGDRVDAGLRVLHAQETFVVLQGFLILVVAWRRLSLRTRWLTAALFTTLVLMQHRTIWVSLAVGLGVLLYRDRELARRAVLLIPVTLMAAAIVVISLFGNPADEVATHATSTDTFEWRFAGWQDLLTEGGPDGPVELAFGKGFGAGWEREVAGQIREESPHSMYIEAILRFGVLGTAVLLVLFLSPIVMLWRQPRTASVDRSEGDQIPWFSNDAILVLLASQATFGLTYFAAPTAGIALGVAAGLGSRYLRRAPWRPPITPGVGHDSAQRGRAIPPRVPIDRS